MEIRLKGIGELLSINSEKKVPLPLCEAKSTLQLAVFACVAMWTDAQVSPLSCLYAGGIASTGLRWAQASICCKKKTKRKDVFRSSLPPIPPHPRLSLFFPLAFVSTLSLSFTPHHLVTKKKKWDHNQPRWTGEQLICSNRTRDVFCSLIRMSNWARSQRQHLERRKQQQVIFGHNGCHY